MNEEVNSFVPCPQINKNKEIKFVLKALTRLFRHFHLTNTCFSTNMIPDCPLLFIFFTKFPLAIRSHTEGTTLPHPALHPFGIC